MPCLVAADRFYALQWGDAVSIDRDLGLRQKVGSGFDLTLMPLLFQVDVRDPDGLAVLIDPRKLRSIHCDVPSHKHSTSTVDDAAKDIAGETGDSSRMAPNSMRQVFSVTEKFTPEVNRDRTTAMLPAADTNGVPYNGT